MRGFIDAKAKFKFMRSGYTPKRGELLLLRFGDLLARYAIEDVALRAVAEIMRRGEQAAGDNRG